VPVQKHSEGGDLKVDIPFMWYGKLIKFELDTCELDHMRETLFGFYIGQVNGREGKAEKVINFYLVWSCYGVECRYPSSPPCTPNFR